MKETPPEPSGEKTGVDQDLLQISPELAQAFEECRRLIEEIVAQQKDEEVDPNTLSELQLNLLLLKGITVMKCRQASLNSSTQAYEVGARANQMLRRDCTARLEAMKERLAEQKKQLTAGGDVG